VHKCFKTIALVMLAMILGACASGPKYSQVNSTLPAAAADKGRVYFYRSGSPFGAAIQPAVMLNGVKVGDSQPGGFFYVDRSPGNYEVALATEVERKLTFTLDQGQKRYVRMSVGLGILMGRVYPELTDREVAEAELRDLSFTGTLVQNKEVQRNLTRPDESTVQIDSSSVPPAAQNPPATAVPQERSKADSQPAATLDDLKDLLPQNK